MNTQPLPAALDIGCRRPTNMRKSVEHSAAVAATTAAGDSAGYRLQVSDEYA
jgi:hypothetical protein